MFKINKPFIDSIPDFIIKTITSKTIHLVGTRTTTSLANIITSLIIFVYSFAIIHISTINTDESKRAFAMMILIFQINNTDSIVAVNISAKVIEIDIGERQRYFFTINKFSYFETNSKLICKFLDFSKQYFVILKEAKLIIKIILTKVQTFSDVLSVTRSLISFILESKTTGIKSKSCLSNWFVCNL